MAPPNTFSFKALALAALAMSLNAIATPVLHNRDSTSTSTRLATAGPACGQSACAADEVCCNDSCGTCTKPGGTCTMQLCVARGQACGTGACAADEVCCNNSCGICTKPGDFCTTELCSS